MRRALYEPGGFYARGELPAAHFRTSVHASGHFAAAFARLLGELDRQLGRPARLDVVDMGAGGGELLTGILAAVPADLGDRLAPTAVELRPAPPGPPGPISWTTRPPERINGLVIGNEWLDNVPLDVAEITARGPRLLLVEHGTGAERPGPAPSTAEREWLRRWWPADVGGRAEIGLSRCTAWAETVHRVDRGLAVAVDYAHTAAHRPPAGTLTGFRDGRAVPPVPDGSCDITAHVALDACAAAGLTAGASDALSIDQRTALRALGVRGRRPSIELAHRDPREYLRALNAAGEQAELLDPGGLGGFGWLIQPVGIELPPAFAGLRSDLDPQPGQAAQHEPRLPLGLFDQP